MADEFGLQPEQAELAADSFYWFLVLGQIEKARDNIFQILQTCKIPHLISNLPFVEKTIQGIALSSAMRSIQVGEIDGLTQAWDRKTLSKRIDFLQSLIKDKLLDAEYILILHFIDADKFKQVNDTYGHVVGDRALQKLVEVIKKYTRVQDSIYRYGGEEFCLLQVINLENYRQAAQKAGLSLDQYKAHKARELRKKIVEKLTIEDRGQKIQISISTGVTQILPDHEPHEQIDQADKLMLEAKNNGRRQCKTIWDEDRNSEENQVNE